VNGYPADPHPTLPLRGVRNALVLAGGFWLLVFLVLLVAFRT
jgi:hypothetical protein